MGKGRKRASSWPAIKFSFSFSWGALSLSLSYNSHSHKVCNHLNNQTKAHIHNNGINFRTPFFLIDKLSSKVILGNPFLALLYTFSTTDNGICTNILETEVNFKFILPPISKDIHLLKEISIFKNINTDEPVTDNDEITTNEFTTNPKVDDITLPSST